MPTEKAAIAEALQSLDQKNDALWTDDGSPLVAELQRICNDKTITRAQINDALPGFARKTDDSVVEDVQPDAEVQPTAPNTAAATMVAQAQVALDEDESDLSPEQEQLRLRAIAYQRVRDAELFLAQAKETVSEAQRAVVSAEQRHDRALHLFSAKYPPMSPAENIKQHLARQQEVLRERVTGSKFEPNAAQNPVDATLMDRKRDNGRKGNAPTAFLPRKAAVNY
jgi:hypothetical protein